MRVNNNAMIAVAFVVGCSCLFGAATATKEKRGGGGKKKMKDMTVFERQSDDGLRHSPLFSLDVGGDRGVGYPRKMVIFTNDLYDDEDDLVADDDRNRIGYDQGYCVETISTSGLVAECFYTFVLDDEEGTITANGPFNFVFDGETGAVMASVLAIAGGTGKYKGAKGEIYLSAGPAEAGFPSLQFDFNF